MTNEPKYQTCLLKDMSHLGCNDLFVNICNKKVNLAATLIFNGVFNRNMILSVLVASKVTTD